MLEYIVKSEIVYYVIGIAGVLGILSKLIVGITLRKLVKAASDMSKSTHKFMKLVRAKFEHACMVNERVDNVDVFVSKYIQEYKVMGVSIHTWQRFEKIWVYVTLIAATIRIVVIYYYAQLIGSMSQIEMTNSMIVTGSIAVAECIVLIGIYQIGDEKYKLSALKVYMIDYLENVYAQRLQKKKEKQDRMELAVKSDVSISNKKDNRLEKKMNRVTQQNKIQSPSYQENKNQESHTNLEEKPVLYDVEHVELEHLELEQVELKNSIPVPVVDTPISNTKVQKSKSERKSTNTVVKVNERLDEDIADKISDKNQAAIREILQEFMA